MAVLLPLLELLMATTTAPRRNWEHCPGPCFHKHQFRAFWLGQGLGRKWARRTDVRQCVRLPRVQDPGRVKCAKARLTH